MYSSHIINSQLLLLDAMFVKSFISMIPIIQPKYSNTSLFYIIFHSKPKQKAVQHKNTYLQRRLQTWDSLVGVLLNQGALFFFDLGRVGSSIHSMGIIRIWVFFFFFFFWKFGGMLLPLDLLLSPSVGPRWHQRGNIIHTDKLSC